MEKARGAQFERYSAVALFLQRAHQVHAAFAPGEDEKQAIARICRLVEGMPLAIELAASWTPMLSCAEIVHEIEQNLDILTSRLRDAPLRHRSLEAVFAHSWRLLSAEEQRLFAQLSVFRGRFTRQAAAQVAGATLPDLFALADKSLLRRADNGTYEIHELTRQFATARLQELGELAATRKRHEAYFVALAEEGLDRVRDGYFRP
jgi:predicted ATPase